MQRQPVAAAGVDERSDHGVLRVAGLQASRKLSRPEVQSGAAGSSAGQPARAVDDLIRTAHESVQRMHRRPNVAREAGRRAPVRRIVTTLEALTDSIGLLQGIRECSWHVRRTRYPRPRDDATCAIAQRTGHQLVALRCGRLERPAGVPCPREGKQPRSGRRSRAGRRGGTEWTLEQWRTRQGQRRQRSRRTEKERQEKQKRGGGSDERAAGGVARRGGAGGFEGLWGRV
jgi:hypothetical protein